MLLNKILVISNMYPSDSHKSFGVFVQKFVRQMEENGIECDLAVIKGKGINTREKLFKYLIFYFEVIYKFFFSSHQLIYIHYVAHVAPIILILRVFKKSFLVCNFHGGDLLPDTKNEELLLPFSIKLARKANLTVVPSSYYKQVLTKKMEIANTQIIVSASSGVNLERFNTSRKTNSSKEKFTLGFVSRIDKDKGWDTFILALKKLKKNIPALDFQAIMVGFGSEMDQLRKLIEDSNLNHFVDLIGEVSNHKLPEYFAQMDLFIFPTRRNSESLGLVGLEAMACGVPVIASKIGGITDYLIPNKTGLLFQPGNSDDLVDKINLWLNFSKEQQSQIINNGLIICKEFEETVVATNLIHVLNQNYETHQRQ